MWVIIVLLSVGLFNMFQDPSKINKSQETLAFSNFLDEVDAALDDQNVARFCHQIGELSARTQMMLITHNAVTVEAASTVYGVTMSKDGVSELLSIRLDDMALNGQTANGRTTIPASTNGLHNNSIQSVPG